MKPVRLERLTGRRGCPLARLCSLSLRFLCLTLTVLSFILHHPPHLFSRLLSVLVYFIYFAHIQSILLLSLSFSPSLSVS